MPTESQKAYHVGEGSEGEHVITFASSSAQARREAGNELGLEFNEVSFCRRAPWADEFAGQRFIPAKAYHDQGRWLYCNNCETQLYEDAAEDNDGNPLTIIYDGRHAYCDQDCKDSRDKLIADADAKGAAFKAKVLAERPGLTFGEFSIGYPHIIKSVTFKFPGCQYGGSVRDQEDNGELHWYVPPG
ncbi:hypothetical protein [Pseudomonas sp. MHK4]